MSKKDLAAKLAQGVRLSRQPSPVADSGVAVATDAALTKRATHYARQADQSPPPSLDRPWDNLHPERIWPD